MRLSHVLEYGARSAASSHNSRGIVAQTSSKDLGALPWPGASDPIPKAFRRGTHRQIAPEQTLARVEPHLARMGITRVANITGLDCIGIPVAQAIRPNSRALAVSQGKGLTLAAAKASAVMESIESWHAERITLPLKLASYDDLRADHRVVDVETVNRPKKTPFHGGLPLLWIEGFDLLQRESVWIPYELVDTNYTYPQPPGSGCFAATSNGLASGNGLLEAINHGICEVVERDATTLWGLSGRAARSMTCVDLDTVEDESCREVLEKFRAARVEVRAWEATSDIGMPVFLCKVRDRHEVPNGPNDYPGYGCHGTRAIALLRALTEAAQGRLTFIAGARDDMVRNFYEEREGPAAARIPELESSPDAPLRDFADGPGFDGDTVAEDIGWALDRLRAAGVPRVIVVNLTKPELGVPVVRVVIPTLEIAIVTPGFYVLGERARRVIAKARASS